MATLQVENTGKSQHVQLSIRVRAEVKEQLDRVNKELGKAKKLKVGEFVSEALHEELTRIESGMKGGNKKGGDVQGNSPDVGEKKISTGSKD